MRLIRSSTQSITETFRERFGGDPTHLARAPGRVNLIGEHTDYNDLPVLPMALQREARIAFRPRDDGMVVLHDVDAGFGPIEFEILPGIPADPAGHWANYAKGPADLLARRFAIWRGFEGVLGSDVPVAAGLSSSSAIVTAVGLVLAHINEVPVEPRSFAELMADAERFTGTMGGSMDHTISMNGRAGCAAKISFKPAHMRQVQVPADWCFIIADSGKRAEKAGAAQNLYNLRRKECEEAFSFVVEAVVRSNRVHMIPTDYPSLLRAVPTDELLSIAEDVLKSNLLRRFRHIVTEAGRVEEAIDFLRAADAMRFGTLMDASHGSLRTDYLVSSPQLDELAAIAREGGAAGARLTGAGFGGCIVALSDRSTVDLVLEALVSEYYEPKKLVEALDERLFIAVASDGASVRSL